MKTLYRISFEAVDAHYAASINENTPSAVIPEDKWHGPIYKETEDPWDQYNTLKAWEGHGIGMVRNVKLEKADLSEWRAFNE